MHRTRVFYRNADRVINTGRVQYRIVPEQRVAHRDVLVDMLMNGIGPDDGPSCHTVTSVAEVVMDIHVMPLVIECVAVHNCVVVDTRCLDERVFRPEQLNRITLTQVVRCIKRLSLLRTHDHVVIIRTVAVPDNGIRVVFQTCPFAFPFTVVAVIEGRMFDLTQDYRILFDRRFTTER